MMSRRNLSVFACTGLALVLFISSCGPVSDSRPMLSGLVDKFEDGDQINELLLEWEAIAEGPETSSVLFVDTGGFDPSSVYFLTVGGVRPFGGDGSDVAGARSKLSGSNSDVSVYLKSSDVSAYDGLAFSMKGTPGSYIVQLGSAAVTDFDYFNTYVALDEQWRGFKMSFADFHQEGFGSPVTWTGTDVIHVAFYANLTGPFTFAVDDVQFYSEDDLIE